MDRIHEDMILPPDEARALSARWMAEDRAVKLALAALPPGTTRAEAMDHLRELSQVGRRYSACKGGKPIE